MPLIINGKTFSKYDLSAICTEIQKLPDVEIESYESLSIPEEETIMCLQQEIIYVNTLNPGKKLNYAGSKDTGSCVVAYLYSSTDHLLVHMDSSSAAVDLESYLLKFTDQSSIEVILIGAALDSGNVSTGNIDKLINLLFTAAEKTKLNITIKNQKVLERYKLPDSSKDQLLFENILLRTDIFCRQYFNSPLYRIDREYLGLPCDFRNKDINTHAKIDLRLVRMSIHMDEIYHARDPKLQDKLNLFSDIKKDYKNKQALLDAIKNIISKQGAKILYPTLKNVLGKIPLRHFVFDIHTKKIHVVNAFFHTPYLERRGAKRLEIYVNPDKKYFCSFDGNEWQVPTFSRPLMTMFNEWCQSVINNCLDADNDVYAQRLLIIKSLRYVVANPALPKNTNQTLFRPQSDWEAEDKDNPLVHSNLFHLEKMTGLTFKLKLRHHPAYTVDAFHKIESLPEIKKLQVKLSKHGIPAYIIRMDDEKKQLNDYLCIPAINSTRYGNVIVNAKSASGPSH